MIGNKKIIDAFIFCDEVDLLKFRIEQLNQYVDYFIILESNYYTNGKKKKSLYHKNKKLFSEWSDKIICLEYDASKIKNKKNIIRNQYLLIKKIIFKLNLKYDDIFILSQVNEIYNLEYFDDIESSLSFEPVILLNKCFYKYKNFGVNEFRRSSIVFQYTHILQNNRVIEFYIDNKNMVSSVNSEIIENGWYYEKKFRLDKKTIKIDLDKIDNIIVPNKEYYESENFNLEYRVNELKKEIYNQDPIEDDVIIFDKKITSKEVIWKDLKNNSIYSFVKSLF